ncbi:UNVERIFIED_CONTAM: hypothetical protein GTU68_001295, partial [Idotea baltica]|nr:hypothetical protein [Idotea baltica]
MKGGLCAARGFFGSAVSCGIKDPESKRLDLGLIYSEFPCLSKGAFTQNRVKAAPLQVTQNNLKTTHARAIITNSGNANACTGVVGITDAKTMAKATAKLLSIKQREVAVCSTGVIGLPLPMARINPHYEELVEGLGPKNGKDVASAIITSDTHEKEFAISLQIGEKRIRIGGCAKGAGMINPNMATMLCYITTDARIAEASLEKAFKSALEHTFNRITIDGDTSTNDTVLVLANGAAGNKTIRRGSKECQIFEHALRFVMNKLAKAIVRDGERVTKFVTLKV